MIEKVSYNNLYLDFYLNQAVTKHGIFPDFQKLRFNKSDRCIYNHAQGTVEHIIFDCHLWDNVRNDYFTDVAADSSIKELLLKKRSSLGVQLIIQECVKAALP